MLTISFIFPFFFFPNINFLSKISQLLRQPVFKFCIHLQRIEVNCVKENYDAETSFAFFFTFFLFSISHSSVMHRESCVIDNSGTAAPMILKFGATIGYDYLYCLREIQHFHAYHSLYLSIFLFHKMFRHTFLSNYFT